MSILDKMTMRELQFIQAAFIGRLMERHRMEEEEATTLAGEFVNQGRVSCEERASGRLVGFFLDGDPLIILTWERLRHLAANTPMIGEDLDKKLGEQQE
jgi:hypothetical protein